MHKRTLSVVLLIGTMTSGCTHYPTLACRNGDQTAVLDSLYLGTETPNGIVTDSQWQEFLAQIVTPRFPQGLTTWSAEGQWRSATNENVKEKTHILHITHPNDDTTHQAVLTIVNEYKVRFKQEAVLRIRSNVCVTF